MSALLEAVELLSERLMVAGTIGEAFDQVAGEVAPAWVQVYQRQIEGIRAAAEEVEVFVRRGGL